MTIQNLVIRLGSFKIVVPNMVLNRSEVIFLHGRSGSGKSTILKAVSGLIDNQDNDDLCNEFNKIGFIMHDSTLIPWLKIEQHIRIEERLRRCSFSYELFNEYSFRCNLDKDILSKRGSDLSQGMRQRIEICKCLSFGCELILCDEAFSGIDQESKIQIMVLLSEYITKSGAIILATSHSNIDILRLADRVYFVSEGQVSNNSLNILLNRLERIKMCNSDLELLEEAHQIRQSD